MNKEDRANRLADAVEYFLGEMDLFHRRDPGKQQAFDAFERFSNAEAELRQAIKTAREVGHE